MGHQQGYIEELTWSNKARAFWWLILILLQMAWHNVLFKAIYLQFHDNDGITVPELFRENMGHFA